MRRIIGMMLIAMAVGCSDADMTTLGAESPELDDIDQDSEPSTPIDGAFTERWSQLTFDPENVEKGTMSMLLGNGIRGVLHFQDGVRNEPDGIADHCQTFGLICDNRWHTQARALDLSGRTKFGAEWTGACADPNNAWEPCVMPKIGPSGASRNFKWKLDMTTCPQTAAYSAQRTAMINGWASVRAQTSATHGNPVIGIGITWTETTGNDWHYLVKCERYTDEPTLGMYYPADSFTTLKYALAVNGGPNIWNDRCETSGLPGYNANPNLANLGVQQHDMMYEIDRHVINVDMVEMANTGNNCINCANETSRCMYSYHNVILHEFGHSMGLQHDQLAALDFQVMKDSTTCAEGTNRKFAFHPFYREALRSLDTTTNSAQLTVWDDDISCFIPDEY